MAGLQRAFMPDYLRLFGLFGIVVVNVQYIAFSVLNEATNPPAAMTVDAVTFWLVDGLAQLKTYGLFSFMFGVGLGFLMRSATKRELPFGQIYRNRMIGLLLLGIAHGCLFFPGDILTTYAAMGSILYLFRDYSVGRLVRIGLILIIVQVALASLIAPFLSSMPETPSDFVSFENSILTEGRFIDAVLFRSISFAIIMPFVLLFQGSAALGWFCLGFAAVKSGMIDEASHPLWRRARRWCLLPGIFVSLAAAAMSQWGHHELGGVLTVIAAPVATVGYLGLIAAISRPPGPIMAKVLAAGGSSLSIYLGQSIVLSTIFSGYGLGLWGAVDRLAAVIIAVAVTISLMGAVLIWRTHFPLAPFEWLLRRFTYGRLGH